MVYSQIKSKEKLVVTNFYLSLKLEIVLREPKQNFKRRKFIKERKEYDILSDLSVILKNVTGTESMWESKETKKMKRSASTKKIDKALVINIQL